MQIPSSASRVFKGEIFDVYQWEQNMYDGSTATFEMLKRPATIQVIPVSGDIIYLAHEEQPMKPKRYTLLGGRQEEGEEPLVSARRELLEEAGLASDDWELFLTFDPVGKMEWTVYVYVARECTKIHEQKLDAGEKIDVIETDFDQFIETVTDRSFWGKEISNELYRWKCEGRLEELKQKLFLQEGH